MTASDLTFRFAPAWPHHGLGNPGSTIGAPKHEWENLDERGIRTPPPLANSGYNKLRQGATIRSYFHEALNWQVPASRLFAFFSLSFHVQLRSTS